MSSQVQSVSQLFGLQLNWRKKSGKKIFLQLHNLFILTMSTLDYVSIQFIEWLILQRPRYSDS